MWVEFEIASGSQLDQNLPEGEAKGDLVQEVTAEIRSLCELHFGFLRWREAGQPGAKSKPAAILRVALTDEKRNSGTENRLRFSASIGEEQIDMSHVKDITIYDQWVIDKHSAGQLRETIFEKLEKEFAERAAKIHEVFLRQVSLSQEVFADENTQRIYLTLNWRELKASPDTILLVEFKSSDGGGEQIGLLEIGRVKLSDQPCRGCVEGIVWSYDMAPTTLEKGEWNQVIPSDLERASVKEVKMWVYKYQAPRELATLD